MFPPQVSTRGAHEGTAGYILKMAHSHGWKVGVVCWLGAQLSLSAKDIVMGLVQGDSTFLQHGFKSKYSKSARQTCMTFLSSIFENYIVLF